jgi:hypothetical protein
MSDNRLPTEVELVYEVMPCNALRSVQEPSRPFAHSCSYFRQWGRYHSYDYQVNGPPPQPGIVQLTQYVGRAALVPELLSGCRKAPIMAVGINPNLPGWWRGTRNSINPLFDDYKQYAHYFRYRTTAKLQIPRARYADYRDGQNDSPLGDFELDIPADPAGVHAIPVELQVTRMYENYQSLLIDLAETMGWTSHNLSLGEDVSYGNMVACPSAKWITRPDSDDPDMPPMTIAQQQGIVRECFHERRYFLRQLFQSLPSVLMVFSQSTTDAFLGELQGRFSQGNPQPGDRIADLLERNVRLKYGTLPNGTVLDARVIFSPHITGNPGAFGPARAKVLAQLVEEAQAGRLTLNPATGHLRRPVGSCVFCPVMEVGLCDYEAELQQLTVTGVGGPGLLATGEAEPKSAPLKDKKIQYNLLKDFLNSPPSPEQIQPPGPGLAAAQPESSPAARPADLGWSLSGDPERQPDRSEPDVDEPT